MKRGAEIFSKYVDPNKPIGGAGHDVIWFAPFELEINKEDRKELKSLGFLVSNEYQSWIHYA
jgi:hypothetical protein